MPVWKELARNLLTVSSMLGFATIAYGSVDLRNLPSNVYQGNFGQPFTPFFAQSVIADNVLMDEASGLINPIMTLKFNFMITGDRPDAGGGLGFAPDLSDIRFNSGELNLASGQGLTEIVIHPNITVTSGERLFLVFDAFSYLTSGTVLMRATEYDAVVDPYPPGEFVYFNSTGQTTFAQVNGQSWEHRGRNNEDLAIFASFVAPEPGSFCLLGVAACVITGCGFRRRPSIAHRLATTSPRRDW